MRQYLPLYIAGPIVLFLLARLAFTNDADSQDLAAWYPSVSSTIWYLAGAFFAFALPFNVVLLDVPLVSAGPISQIALFCYAMICANTANPVVHYVGVAGLFLQSLWRGISSVVGA